MLLLAALLAAPFAAASPLPGDAYMVSLTQEIAEIRALLRASGDPRTADEIRRRIEAIEASLTSLDAARFALIDRAAHLEGEALALPASPDRPGLDARDGLAPRAERPAPATAEELARIRQAVASATFAGDKIERLRSASRDRHFTAGQVREIVGWFGFGKDKVEAAATLHPLVVDPENWFEVYGALSFESDRRALRQRVGD